MRTISSAIVLGMLVLSPKIFAAPQLKITKTSEGDFSVQYCDGSLRAGSFIAFQIENGILEKEVINSSNCANKAYSKGSLAENKKLTVHRANKSDWESAGILTVNSLRPTTQKTEESVKSQTPGEFRMEDMKFTIRVSESIRNGEASKIELKVCSKNFKFADSVVITNRATLGTAKVISKSSNVNRDLCFLTDWIKGEIQNEDEIGIGLYSREKPIALVVDGIPWKRTVNTTASTSTPTNSPTTPPPLRPASAPVVIAPAAPAAPIAPKLKLEPREEIVKSAEIAATNFAKNVVKALGQIENIRYNLFLGFSDARRWSQAFGRDYVNMNEYKLGYTNAYDSAFQSGLSAGRDQARSYTKDLAKSDVGEAIDRMMSGRATTFEVAPRSSIKQAPFTGLNYKGDAPNSLEARLKQKDQEIQDRLNREFVVRDGEIVLADDFYKSFETYRLVDLQKFQFDLLDSYFKEQNAFEAWAKGYFQPRQDRQFDYYRNITDSREYDNVDENRRLFREAFQDKYSRSAPTQWQKTVEIYRPEIKRAGEEIYIRTAKEYAEALGRYNATIAAFKAGSKQSFFENLEILYKSALKTAVEDVSTKANFTNIVATVSNSSGGAEVTIGDTIDMTLNSAANRGLKSGVIDIRPTASAFLVPLKSSMSYNMSPLQTLRSPVHFSALLFVSRVTRPDQDIAVNIQIDGEKHDFILHSSFEALTRALLNRDERIRSSVLEHIIQFLRQEWNEKKEFAGNGFDDNTGRLLVERLTNVVLSLPESQRISIRAIGPQIRSAYAERPGFFSGYQADWDSAMTILNRAGL